jgi:hypothetical protein
MVMSATSLSDVSLMAIVPDSECRMPILIGPLSSAGAGAAGAAGAAPGAGAGASLLQADVATAEMAASDRTAVNDPVNDLRMFVPPVTCWSVEKIELVVWAIVIVI